MDKLKQNAFGLALGGAALLLLVLAYFLVWSPLQDVGAKSSTVDAVQTQVSRYNKSTKPIPTAEIVEDRENVRERERKALEDGLGFYDGRTALFRQYFDGATTQPLPDEFFTTYNDRERTLLGNYRQKFQIPIAEEGKETPPEIKGRPDASAMQPEKIEPTMKQFWIIEAVVGACDKLGIGGLQSISFEEQQRSGRSAAAAAKPAAGEPAKKPPFTVRHVWVELKVALRYGQIRPLLGELFSSERVPFVEVASLEYTKPAASRRADLTLVRTIEEDPADGKPKPAARDLVSEPLVEATIQLRALDLQVEKPEEAVADDTEEAGAE